MLDLQSMITSKSYKAIFGLIFFVYFHSITAQSTVDSLLQVLNTSLNDTTRVQMMNQIAAKSFYKNPVLTDSITTEAIALSQEIDMPNGEAYALKYKGISHAIRGHYHDARGFYEQSLELFIGLGNKREIAALYYAIGISYSEVGQYNSAEAYYKKALDQQKNRQDTVGMANTYIGISGLYKNMSLMDQAVLYLDSAMTLYDLQGMELEKSITHNRMANIYLLWGNYPKALESTQLALKYNEANQLEQKMAINYHTLGTIYAHLEDYELAMKYYNKSVELKEKLDLIGGLALTIKNMGDLNSRKGNYEEALKQYRKTIRLTMEVGQACKSYNSKFSIGRIYLELGQLDSASYYLKQAKARAKTCEDITVLTSTNLELGSLSLQRGDEKSAEILFLEAYQLAKDYDFNSHLKNASQKLYEFYKSRNNSSKALLYLEQAQTVYDSLFNEKNDREIARLESQYKFEKEKVLLDEQYKQKQIKQEALLEKEILIRNTAIIIAIVVLIFGVIISAFYMKIRKINNQLNAQNDQIVEQNNKLEQLNSNRSKLLSLLAHDLRSPLGNMIGIFDLIQQQELTQNEIELFSRDIQFRIKNLLDFLDNVLNWSKSNFSDIPILKTEVEAHQLMGEVVSMLNETCKEKGITIESFGEERIDFEGDVAMLKVVFRNILSNAIKFSHPQGMIEVRFEKDDRNVYFTIQDHGVGMTQEIQKRLFHDTLKSHPGTKNEMGAGIGLYLSKDFVDRHGGKIEVSSKSGKGTTMLISIPIS